MMNKRGPKIEPCGTPVVTDIIYEFFFEPYKLSPTDEITFKPC